MSNQNVVRKSAPKLPSDQTKQVQSLPTTSSKMRYLESIGMSRADIARYLNKRYQHVKNVLDKPLKS